MQNRMLRCLSTCACADHRKGVGDADMLQGGHRQAANYDLSAEMRSRNWESHDLRVRRDSMQGA